MTPSYRIRPPEFKAGAASRATGSDNTAPDWAQQYGEADGPMHRCDRIREARRSHAEPGDLVLDQTCIEKMAPRQAA